MIVIKIIARLSNKLQVSLYGKKVFIEFDGEAKNIVQANNKRETKVDYAILPGEHVLKFCTKGMFFWTFEHNQVECILVESTDTPTGIIGDYLTSIDDDCQISGDFRSTLMTFHNSPISVIPPKVADQITEIASNGRNSLYMMFSNCFKLKDLGGLKLYMFNNHKERYSQTFKKCIALAHNL